MIKKFHLILGIVLFIWFLVTGLQMYFYFPDKTAIAADYRLLMRSRHIYILFNSLIHVLVSLCFVATKGWKHVSQFVGSVLLTIGSTLLILGFYLEVFAYREVSSISAFGVQATFAGILAYLIPRCGKSAE